MTRTPSLGLVILLAAACSDPTPVVEHHKDAERPRRVIERPLGEVHALPPYAIRPDGVGPYRLDLPTASVLAGLPSGPRGVAVLDLPGMVRLSVIRAEDDKILIGGEPLAATSFVSVLAGDVARTEGGLAVGSRRDDIAKELGPELNEPDRISDPRLTTYQNLPGARFLSERGVVVAIILTDPPPATESLPTTCAPLLAATPEALFRLGLPADSLARPACLSAAGEFVIAADDNLVVASAGLERRLASVSIPGLQVVGAARTEQRDEIIAIRRQADADSRQWYLSVWRFEGGKLSRIAEDQIYQVNSSSAAWIGARLTNLELVVEVAVQPDSLVTTGLLIDRANGTLHDLVPLLPFTVPRRRRPTMVAPQGSELLPDAAVLGSGGRGSGSSPRPGRDAGAGAGSAGGSASGTSTVPLGPPKDARPALDSAGGSSSAGTHADPVAP